MAARRKSHEGDKRQTSLAVATKITPWSIRADAVPRLDRGEPEPEAVPSGFGKKHGRGRAILASVTNRQIASRIATRILAAFSFKDAFRAVIRFDDLHSNDTPSRAESVIFLAADADYSIDN